MEPFLQCVLTVKIVDVSSYIIYFFAESLIVELNEAAFYLLLSAVLSGILSLPCHVFLFHDVRVFCSFYRSKAQYLWTSLGF